MIPPAQALDRRPWWRRFLALFTTAEPVVFTKRKGELCSGRIAERDPEWWIECECGRKFILVKEPPPHYAPFHDPQYPCVTCPKCGMVSYNENDIRYEYCGNCNGWHASLIPTLVVESLDRVDAEAIDRG